MTASACAYSDLTDAPASAVRQAIRRGSWLGPTAGLARGCAQANLVILPARYAADFAEFCRRNPRPCPLIAQTEPGNPCPAAVAPDADLRTDLPRYRVFRDGLPAEEPADILALWRDDLVSFLLGCSFTFEHALSGAGLTPRHLAEGKNVPMYVTSLPCRPAGPFAGPLVVSMRPYRIDQIEMVRAITAQFPLMHGEPVQVGEPPALGIEDLCRPDFGDPVTIGPDEVPVFWACGVTPQLALSNARPEICITHSPGCMFIMDRRDESFRQPPGGR
jgi:uncharacterized protein YcsI (UPF0317 family)